MARKTGRTLHFVGLSIVLVVVIFLFVGSRTGSIISPDTPYEDHSRSSSENQITPPSTTRGAGMSKTKKNRDGAKPGNDRHVETEPGNEEIAHSKSTTTRFCDTRDKLDVGPCIFDIGLNTGQDTKQYLALSPTSRVVAIEANPTLIDDAKGKFQDEIKAGRLELVNIGLIGNETKNREAREKVTFWVNTANDVFSSFKQSGGCRGPGGVFLAKGNTTYCRKIEMDTMSCAELIKEYGTPFYMKVDIEGMDRACVQSLGNVAEKDRPNYISKENIWITDIEILTTLGYKSFKVVNQNALQSNLQGTDLIGHSGPWGEDAEDFWIGKKWHSREELLRRLPLPESIEVGSRRVKGWYDLHSKK